MLIDLGRAVGYNGYSLNSAGLPGDGAPLTGCKIENIAWSPVQAFGYNEKRARADGADVSDVTLGPRRFRITGTLYATTKAELYAGWDDLVAALAPTLTYRVSPDERGYLPLTFSRPFGDDVSETPINMMMRARALTLVTPVADSDRIGPTAYSEADGYMGGKAPAIPWYVDMEAADPRAYSYNWPYETLNRRVDISDIVPTGEEPATDFPNVGNYYAPMRFVIISSAHADQEFTFVGCGADIRITIPDLAVESTIVFDGRTGKLTLSYGGNTIVRPDLLVYEEEQAYPEVPPGGGSGAWNLTGGNVLLAGSYIEAPDTFI